MNRIFTMPSREIKSNLDFKNVRYMTILMIREESWNGIKSKGVKVR